MNLDKIIILREENGKKFDKIVLTQKDILYSLEEMLKAPGVYLAAFTGMTGEHLDEFRKHVKKNYFDISAANFRGFLEMLRSVCKQNTNAKSSVTIHDIRQLLKMEDPDKLFNSPQIIDLNGFVQMTSSSPQKISQMYSKMSGISVQSGGFEIDWKKY